MKKYFLCFFAVATLPNVLAILCYICSLTSSENFCQSVSDVSECGDKVEGASTTARLCANISFEILFGGQTMNANIMKCESKSFCDSKQKREEFCKDFLDGLEKNGITVRKCLYNCCSEDRCNGPHGSGFGSNHKHSPLITSFRIVSLVFASFLNY